VLAEELSDDVVELELDPSVQRARIDAATITAPRLEYLRLFGNVAHVAAMGRLAALRRLDLRGIDRLGDPAFRPSPWPCVTSTSCPAPSSGRRAALRRAQPAVPDPAPLQRDPAEHVSRRQPGPHHLAPCAASTSLPPPKREPRRTSGRWPKSACGDALQTDQLPGDANLTSGSLTALEQWLERHGVDLANCDGCRAPRR
jgi:hypothetical protein